MQDTSVLRSHTARLRCTAGGENGCRRVSRRQARGKGMNALVVALPKTFTQPACSNSSVKFFHENRFLANVPTSKVPVVCRDYPRAWYFGRVHPHAHAALARISRQQKEPRALRTNP